MMMERPKIILDTNCLLQILGAKSCYHFLFTELLAERYILCVSTEILFEYEEILRQKASPTAADLFMKVIARSRNVVRKDPYFRLGLIKQDADDNKFVDCAFVCQADFIVTDDVHFNDAANSPFPLFRVMGLDEFAKRMKE
jgi:putative PIN family toxin of toxin-antitoxin system